MLQLEGDYLQNLRRLGFGNDRLVPQSEGYRRGGPIPYGKMGCADVRHLLTTIGNGCHEGIRDKIFGGHAP